MNTTKQISFEVSNEDAALIKKIVDRAVRDYQMQHKIRLDRMDTTMDLTACHANGCPMNFAGLLAADDFNFAHDISGINRHLNRTTGELENCFLPRFSKKQ